jgi:hypothetical protein
MTEWEQLAISNWHSAMPGFVRGSCVVNHEKVPQMEDIYLYQGMTLVVPLTAR